MSKKVYTSYDEIERDLEILALEKEIGYRKLEQSFDNVKESLSPSHLLSKVPPLVIDAVSSIPTSIKTAGLAFLVRKIFKSKKEA